MTTLVPARTKWTSAPRFGRLFRTELRRLAGRRFTVVLLGVCVLGYLIAVAYLWQAHAKQTPADLAQATVQRDQQIVEIKQQIAQCMAQPDATVQNCGTVPTADEYAVALAGFALAATFIGAEWSTKNLIAWLFYEPRRMRLMMAKILAVSGVTLALSVFAQVVWAVTARLLISARGLPVSSLGADAGHFWTDVLQVQLRSALLVVPAVLLGFGLANLIRNTAAALGIAFVYFLIVESVSRGISPALQPYLFTTGVQAWVTKGGITVFGDMAFDARTGSVQPLEIHVSNLHGGVTLLVYAGVVLALSLLLFRRRDIT